jgi:hypothetical protein
MHKQLELSIILFILLLVAIPITVYASVTVGVKNGDWVEYQVTIIGNVPADHNVTWAKLEVTVVEGNTINLNITSGVSNSHTSPVQEEIVLNLEKGILGDGFIIPANLKTDDTFLDSHQGSITIAETKQLIVAGAKRNIISGYTNGTNYSWDQTTGILIEANTNLTDYNMTTKIDKTNIWQQQPTEVNPIILYTLVISVSVIAISSIILVSHRKKHGAA